MKITPTMDLDALAERIGPYATRDDARRMRDLLVAGCWPDTAEVPADIWERMMDDAVLHAEGL